ncbi:hypothetical protein QWI17_18565 [Gilvimarinus sp. SDUM040013]|uniref:Ubiquinone biosynthesis accessory factor UbiJ n=1 Tax=Gilvimarinus gilvus TaxID=3058038 RepID=A0ABU4RV76_9GAMM|nr:hypothetical protein [Gilvimarinus sp. SDUM040013]MDO3387854.1 hypothetical protein [Gilvimarinus sp. SDUM040013]MDX6848775.1 hypothetical protein [Gilvimarinus sp. SDUM040013]
MLGSTAVAALASALETLCHKSLAYDPGSRLRLQALEGQCLAIHCRAPQITLYILPGANIKLQQFYDGDITSSLSGRMDQLLQVAASDVHSLHGTGVTLTGSTQLLVELQNIFNTLDIDWEMWLADAIGTLPAHFMAKHFRQAKHWGEERVASAERLGGEYLREESGSGLGRNEFELFSADINQTRLALDRLQARIERLASTGNAQPQ